MLFDFLYIQDFIMESYFEELNPCTG